MLYRPQRTRFFPPLGASQSLANLFIAADGLSPLLPTAKIVSTTTPALLPAGQNDLYTCPAGVKAIVWGSTFNNATGGTINVTTQLKQGGVYYRLQADFSPANNATAGLGYNPFNGVILEPGDVYSFFTSAPNLTMCSLIVMQFALTEPVRTPRLVGLVAGDNTVYTCPVGKRAFVTNFSEAGTGLLRTGNGTAGIRTYVWNLVPNGGAVAVANRLMTPFTAPANGGSNQTLSTVGLSAGDFLSINSDSSLAGQIAFIPNLVEVPA